MIALALLLAVAGGEAPVDLLRSDQAHHWTTSAAIVANLERRLAVPARMGGPAANFDRYYTGIYRDGHKVVFVEMLNLTVRPPGSGTVHIVSPNKVPGIGDGGCGVVRFSYDTVTQTVSSLECNFDGPGPPPPPR